MVNSLSPPPAGGQDLRRPPAVTLVSAPACHLCLDAEQELLRRAAHGALTVQVVAADSPTGQTLVAAHRPPMFPLVLLDGVVLSAGRLSRGKLDKALARRAARAAVC